MKFGSWIWAADQKEQQRVLKRVSESEHLMTALQAVAKSKEGLSNAQVDEAMANHSNWLTRWTIDQLISLGFLEYKTELFGGPGMYTLTDLGANALSTITGKPVQKQPQAAPPAKPAAAPPVPQSK